MAAEQEKDAPAPEEKGENINDTIHTIETKTVTRSPKDGSAGQAGVGTTEMDDPNGDIAVSDVPGEGSGNGESHGGGGNGGGGGEGQGNGSTPTEHRKSLVSITAMKSRVMCTDKSSGEYLITFIPNSAEQQLHGQSASATVL